ncbi:hypothetical protein BDW74DRAFT_176007 [Aspergillus multicolor]|uniref:uncharacterized protein n=1 Tax=Aspergillus multicolor TaxID=41759 RepID=UPI003CCDA378
MHFSLPTYLLATLAAYSTAIIAAPIPADPTPAPLWTLTGMKRICNAEDTKCTWTFGIKIEDPNSTLTPCTLETAGSQASGGPVTCGSFILTSAWSGYFGADEGFTTFMVHGTITDRTAWPAYTDKQVMDGKVVTPDLGFPVTARAA